MQEDNNLNPMLVLISRKTNRIYYYMINSDSDYHCKEGVIKKEDLLNTDTNTVYSNLSREFLKFKASESDYAQKIKRGPQIITSKDLGYIIARTRVNKNSKIVEAGGGSGGATMFFASIVNSVHTYEIVEDHFNIIKYNLNKHNINNVNLTLGDLSEHIENESDIDLLFLDMPEPKLILEKNLNSIKNGKFIVCYLPSISQIINLYSHILSRDDLYLEEVSEVSIRNWKITNKISRPEHKKEIDHTAFLVFIRKV